MNPLPPLDPVYGLVLASGAALLFGAAAVHKWRDYARFRETLANYDLLPRGAARALAWCVPVAETAIALLLLPRATRAAALAGAIALLCGYAGAIALNLRRGRASLDCGCGGEGQPIAGWMVGRNLLLALVLSPGLLPFAPRDTGALDLATAALAVAALALLYQGAGQLLALPRSSHRSHHHAP
jgi:uncharacterized membrane protein YphA (DoxX/SURF4 family)